MNDKNLYAVLGLLPKADDKVVKAAYRVLSSIYHPDKNSSPEAKLKMQEINSAYEILGDSLKRKKYDNENKFGYKQADSTDFDSTVPFNDRDLDSAWDIIVNIFPDIRKYYLDLKKLSGRLAFSFKLALIEEKNYSKYKEKAEYIKYDYLSTYFGNNKAVMDYAEKLIKLNEREAALYLNKIVNVMGDDVNFKSIEKEVSKSYPKVDIKLRGNDLYKMLRKNNADSVYAATRLVKLIEGGSVSFALFGSKVTFIVIGETKILKDKLSFVDFIRDRYKSFFV